MDIDHGKHSGLTTVERQSGLVQMGKLACPCAVEAYERTIEFVCRRPEMFKTITADNGTEFQNYKATEKATGLSFDFATSRRSWERCTNENTDCLTRPYLPKRMSMTRRVIQADLDAIVAKLNARVGKRLVCKTPEERCAQP